MEDAKAEKKPERKVIVQVLVIYFERDDAVPACATLNSCSVDWDSNSWDQYSIYPSTQTAATGAETPSIETATTGTDAPLVAGTSSMAMVWLSVGTETTDTGTVGRGSTEVGASSIGITIRESPDVI